MTTARQAIAEAVASLATHPPEVLRALVHACDQDWRRASGLDGVDYAIEREQYRTTQGGDLLDEARASLRMRYARVASADYLCGAVDELLARAEADARRTP